MGELHYLIKPKTETEKYNEALKQQQFKAGMKKLEAILTEWHKLWNNNPEDKNHSVAYRSHGFPACLYPIAHAGDIDIAHIEDKEY